nr:hypothetical protein [Tanacetum cinerariifolium]
MCQRKRNLTWVKLKGGYLERELRVTCYTDDGFENDKDDRKFQSGYVFVLNGRAIDWKSAKQSTIVMSSTKSKCIVALEAVMRAILTRNFISRLGSSPLIKNL